MSDIFKILLVEDNRLDSEMFRSLVKRNPDFTSEIEVVTSLEEALSALRHNSTDLIVLDLNLPDSAGLTTFDCVHEATEVPVVIYSGAGERSQTRKALATGAQDYIIKGESDPHSLTRAMRFAVERSRRERSERRMARQAAELERLHDTQKALFPDVPDCICVNSIASAESHPAERASGDCCDLVPFDDSTFMCYLADVSGHGLRASQLMLSVRATIRAISRYTRDPAQILLATDELLYDSFQDGLFVTLIIALVHTDSGAVDFVSAGHSGLLIRANGSITELDSICTPIGFKRLDADSLQPKQVKMSPGDTLFLASDGLSETFDADFQMFGDKRLMAELREVQGQSPREIMRHVLKRVGEFRGDQPQADDITMVCIRYQPDEQTEQ